MNNKKIDFNVLENADTNTVEKIGADNMNIDKDARDRMLKNAMKKYEADKKQLNALNSSNSETSDDNDSVTGVETYNRKKISHAIYTALCSAAALVIVGGSIFMLNRNKPSGPNIPDPVTTPTTTVSATSDAENTTVNTNVKTTANTTAKTTSNAVAKTTVNTSADTAADTTTAAADTPAVTTVAPTPASDLKPYKNPHPDSSYVSDEEIEAAKNRAMNRIMHESIGYTIDGKDEMIETALWNIQTATFDVNDDGIPELFVSGQMVSSNITLMFVYDGSEYVQVKVNRHSWTGTPEVSYVMTGTIKICHRENLISLGAKEGHEYFQTVEVSADNTFTVLSEYNYSGYYKDGRMVIEKGEKNFSDNSAYETYINEYNTHEWRNLEYTYYADKNDHAVKFEEEHRVQEYSAEQ